MNELRSAYPTSCPKRHVPKKTRAQKELADLPKTEYERIRDAVSALAENPRPAGCKKLVGREGWRIRSGDYRTIYEIDDAQKKVTVLDIGHRRDVY